MTTEHDHRYGDPMGFEECITDESGLRRLYRDPSALVLDKAIDHVDDGVRAFIEASPFFVLATTSDEGTDASPRGGRPGFVRVIDEHRIAFGDLSGNNRLDSYRNLVAHPQIGMLFMIPGLDESLRLNGRAVVSDDLTLRQSCALDERIPRVAIGVTVTECFVHCGKAFRRAGLWDPATWPATDERPSPAALLNDHLSLGLDPALIQADLDAGYATMWEPGGQT